MVLQDCDKAFQILYPIRNWNKAFNESALAYRVPRARVQTLHSRVLIARINKIIYNIFDDVCTTLDTKIQCCILTYMIVV